jgi:hypothetical protein
VLDCNISHHFTVIESRGDRQRCSVVELVDLSKELVEEVDYWLVKPGETQNLRTERSRDGCGPA